MVAGTPEDRARLRAEQMRAQGMHAGRGGVAVNKGRRKSRRDLIKAQDIRMGRDSKVEDAKQRRERAKARKAKGTMSERRVRSAVAQLAKRKRPLTAEEQALVEKAGIRVRRAS